MEITNFDYLAVCPNCRAVNYPMTSMKKIEDGDIFDPYELNDYFTSTCINCGYDEMQNIKVVKFANRIFDITKTPFLGEMSLIATKNNNIINSVNFVSSNNNYSPYDQLNAMNVFELYIDLRKKQFNSDPEIEYANPTLYHMYNPREFGTLNLVALFKSATPYVKMKEEMVVGFSFDEIYKIISQLKTSILEIMKRNKLVTFNSTYDSKNGFYL